MQRPLFLLSFPGGHVSTGHWPCSKDVGLLWSRPSSRSHSGSPRKQGPCTRSDAPMCQPLCAGGWTAPPAGCSCRCGQTRLLPAAHACSRTRDHRGCHLLETLKGHALGRPFQMPGASHDVSTCQLEWATRLPDVWFSVTLGVTVFLDEVSI